MEEKNCHPHVPWKAEWYHSSKGPHVQGIPGLKCIREGNGTDQIIPFSSYEF